MTTSVYISSDETFVHVCDICLEGDCNIEAVALCSECDQYFCVTCKTVHERSKASKGHVLVDRDNFNTKTVAMSTKISCNVHGPNKEVNFFCLVHEVPCCDKCKLIEHRGCKRLESLLNIVSKINPKDDGRTLLQKSTKLAKEIECLKSTFENELGVLAKQQDSMVETIRERRLKLDVALDKWEVESVKAVKSKFEKESLLLNDNISICSGVAPEVRANVAKMEQALKKSDEESFIVMKEIEKDNHKYSNTFLEMHKVSHKSEIYLEKDNITKPIETQLKDTIKAGIRYHKIKKALPSFSTRPYKDRVALDAGEINVSPKSDVGTQSITRIEVMHDQHNKILFCDSFNKKLKLFDEGNGSWTETSCSSTPKRICKTDVTNEVIIAQADKGFLQLFTIENGKIMKGEAIKSMNVYDLTKYRNSFITLSFSEAKVYSVDVISKSGQCIRNIRSEPLPSRLFYGTRYQALNAETLYVTDEKYGCIGIPMAGNVVFRYNDKLVKDCAGVTTDPDGNVYLSGTESNNVVMVNSKGETIKVLLDGIEKPRFMKYDEPTNTLFVVQSKSTIVKMFHLM